MSMNWKLLMAFLAAPAAALMAQEGRNLAFNGDFRNVVFNQANGWICPHAPYTTHYAEGGPDNMPYIAMRAGGDDEYENKLRLKYLKLVPGATYHLSAFVRTRGFSATRGELLLVNSPWYNETGITKFPETTDGWQKFEMDVVCPKMSGPGGYDVVLLIIGQRGELDVADIRLTALTAEVDAQSAPPNVLSQIRLVPYGTSFDEVPTHQPEVSFLWFGLIGDHFKDEDYWAEAMVAEPSFISPRVPFTTGQPFVLSLKGLGKGRHLVNVRIIARADSTVAYEESFSVHIRDMPRPEEVTKGRRLNNLSVELFNQAVSAGDTVTFTVAHDTWIYFTINGLDKKEDFRVSLDGQEIGLDELTGLPEAFRQVTAGAHELKANCDGTLIARVIAELFSCGMNQGPDIAIFPPFDWEFARKYALKAVTTLNRGSFVENGRELVEAAHRSGRLWLEDMYVANRKDANDMQQFIEKTMANLEFRDGHTANEVDYSWAVNEFYTPALKASHYDRSKLIYTWIGGNPPFVPSMHQDFIGTCFNAGGGRGKILCETYMFPQPTEAASLKFVKDRLMPYIRQSCMYYPDYRRRSGIILGNFNQLNVITIEHLPQIDFKYYLDLQMNLVANDPEFEGIGTVGYWGTHYADEEMYRWSHELLRHYVVEGRRDMLSTRYGFSYRPGHIVNNDFTDGLNGWTVNAAAADSIAVESFKEYGTRNQNRWSSPKGCGDTFCVFHRGEGHANEISQLATGLVPDKPYMLLFSVGDYDDLKAQKLNPRRLGLDAVLDNAEILPESTVYVDERQKGKYEHNHNVARQNLHRILFKPKASELLLTFTDEKAVPGDNLMFNYIQLKPFFPKD